MIIYLKNLVALLKSEFGTIKKISPRNQHKSGVFNSDLSIIRNAFSDNILERMIGTDEDFIIGILSVNKFSLVFH